MVRGIVASVLLVVGVGWLPFPAGFVLVKVLDPRQFDRQAFHNGVLMAAVSAGPLLVAWLVILLLIAVASRSFPRLGRTIAALGGAAVVGLVAAGAIGGAIGPYGSFVAVLVVPVAVLLLLATLVAHPLLRIVVAPPVKPPMGDPPRP